MSTVETTLHRATSGTRRSRAVRAWVLWTLGFLAFPVAGMTGIAVAGPVDGPLAALTGGLATGAVLGAGQALVSSRRLPLIRWTAATAVGMAVGLLLGAQAVGYGTSMGELAVMGTLTGAVLGAGQATALPSGARRRWLWASAMPLLWATGWVVTTTAGIVVQEQFTLFGASGAITVTAVLGLLLHTVVPPREPTQPPGTGATAASHAPADGAPS